MQIYENYLNWQAFSKKIFNYFSKYILIYYISIIYKIILEIFWKKDPSVQTSCTADQDRSQWDPNWFVFILLR